VTWAVDGKPIKSVLVTRLRYLGDVVMSTVLSEALKAGDPDLRLGYLCEESHGKVLEDDAVFESVHLLAVKRRGSDARARVSQLREASSARGTLATVLELRRSNYDLAIDLFFNPRSAWLLRLAGIPIRIGGTRRSRGRLYTHTAVRSDFTDDESWSSIAPGGLGEHLCRLAPLTHLESGLPFLKWLAGQFQPGQLRPKLSAAKAITGKRSKAQDSYLVLAPGATWPTKEWSLGHWQTLVKSLLAIPGPRLKILIPPGREAEWSSPWSGEVGERLELLPPLSLNDIKSELAGSEGFLTVDGGVMHMAVALGVPTLALFGPTDPNIWFPYEQMGPFRVLATKPKCHPCDLHQCSDFVCLPALTVDYVLKEVRSLFASCWANGGQ
jgi:ADP-heptose:LPS heptosyltransferase